MPRSYLVISCQILPNLTLSYLAKSCKILPCLRSCQILPRSYLVRFARSCQILQGHILPRSCQDYLVISCQILHNLTLTYLAESCQILPCHILPTLADLTLSYLANLPRSYLVISCQDLARYLKIIIFCQIFQNLTKIGKILPNKICLLLPDLTLSYAKSRIWQDCHILPNLANLTLYISCQILPRSNLVISCQLLPDLTLSYLAKSS